MTKQEIFAEIRKILVEEFELEPAKVVPETRFREDLDFDSIDAVDLLVRLQKQTGIKVSAEDFMSIVTLGDIVDVIARLMDRQAR